MGFIELNQLQKFN